MRSKDRVSGLRTGIARAFMGLTLAILCSQPAAAETRSYVLSWILPAIYPHEGDCRVVEPVADPGSTPVESMYRRILVRQGKTPEEATKILQEDPKAYGALLNRGRADGKPVNIFQNPEALPDPGITPVTGKYAIGFNLDGKGADDPGSFEDPYTHEKGVDNQYYRVAGCFRSARAMVPERSGHWQEVWDNIADKAPAFLISVTGQDLSKDGDVVVTFNMAIERPRKDALSKVRRDMTFRVDPNPRSQVSLPGRIENGKRPIDGQ